MRETASYFERFCFSNQD